MTTFRNSSILSIFLIASIVSCWNFESFGQDSKKKKIKPKLRLNYVKEMGGQIKVDASAYYKQDKVKKFCTGKKVGFYTDENYKNLYIEQEVDEEGIATLSLSTEKAALFTDSTGRIAFYTRIDGDDTFKQKNANLSVYDANLDVELLEKDSVRTVKARLTAFDPELQQMVPVNRKSLKVYMVRALSLFPMTEEITYTDSNGVVEVKFPQNVHGDNIGNVGIVVKLLEDDDYGTVVYNEMVNWGIPAAQKLEEERALTRGTLAGGPQNAPLYLVFGITGTILAIWGFLFYTVLDLRRIKKLAKKNQ